MFRQKLQPGPQQFSAKPVIDKKMTVAVLAVVLIMLGVGVVSTVVRHKRQPMLSKNAVTLQGLSDELNNGAIDVSNLKTYPDTLTAAQLYSQSNMCAEAVEAYKKVLTYSEAKTPAVKTGIYLTMAHCYDKLNKKSTADTYYKSYLDSVPEELKNSLAYKDVQERLSGKQ